ncbi:MAG: acyl dehydratase [Rhizobiales bacterium 65-9]|nr:MaoC family dehydratase [Hyphomicrobiales bacterium]OJY38101.1 MAG: acyl dehydratase [Rhizobiales bacterium 65-9]
MTSVVLSLRFDDLTIGQRASLLRTVMAHDLTRFAEISGDGNPVHLSDHFAAKTRFGERIAHGMFTGSLISALIGTRLPGAGAIYLSQSFQFLAPVKIGDVVAASVEVAELIPERRRARLACECWVDATQVLAGDAWVSVPAERVEKSARRLAPAS